MISWGNTSAAVAWRFALAKGAYLLLLFLALFLAGRLDVEQFADVDQRWPRAGPPIFWSHAATWDAAHYLYLSEVGYGSGVHSCAFYPLWPLLMRWFSPIAGGSHLVAGLLLANVLSVTAWLIFYKMAQEKWGTPVAKWSLIFLVLFPGSLFFQFLYSESLFLLLLMVLWWGLERRRYGLAWAAACLLPLTRAVGLFCLLPIGWHALTAAPPAWLRGLGTRWPVVRRLVQPAPGAGGGQGAGCGLAWGLLVAPLVGWGLYLGLMRHWTGNPWEGFEAQKHWGVHAISNLWNVPKFLLALANPTAWHAYAGSLLDRCVFVLLLYCLPVIWRLDRSRGLMIWTFVLGILPAMSGTFTSYTRFASCAFPMFLALGVFLARPEHRHLKWVLLTLFAVLHVVLLWRFVNFRWAG